MPKPWRLTRQAEASLIEIASWTIETFGPRQAAAYEDALVTQAIDGTPCELEFAYSLGANASFTFTAHAV